MRDKLFLVVVLSLVSASCVVFQKPAEPLVRVHASKDLDCPQDDIRVMEEWGGKYKAVGCGRKAYYRTACDGLQCAVHGEGEEFVPSRDRPDPNDRLSR